MATTATPAPTTNGAPHPVDPAATPPATTADAPQPVSRRFRFAPTPSRPLHLGSALAALFGWSLARNDRASFILRIEDIDRTRSKPEVEQTLLADLAWLGLDWDEGPDVGGPFAPYRQSERLQLYDAALTTLSDRGHLYACTCSRADIRQAQSAPHLGLAHEARELPYPGTCRPTQPASSSPANALPVDNRGGLRLDLRTLPSPIFDFDDAFVGPTTEDLRDTCGDPLLGRPSQPTYQLACVVDDLAMGITDIVRGRDLLGSTARQLALREALHAAFTPRFAHHPLLVDDQGRKLSKRDDAPPLESLRQTHSAASLIAALGRRLNLFSNAVHAATANDFRDALTPPYRHLDHDLPANPPLLPHATLGAPA